MMEGILKCLNISFKLINKTLAIYCSFSLMMVSSFAASTAKPLNNPRWRNASNGEQQVLNLIPWLNFSTAISSSLWSHLPWNVCTSFEWLLYLLKVSITRIYWWKSYRWQQFYCHLNPASSRCSFVLSVPCAISTLSLHKSISKPGQLKIWCRLTAWKKME